MRISLFARLIQCLVIVIVYASSPCVHVDHPLIVNIVSTDPVNSSIREKIEHEMMKVSRSLRLEQVVMKMSSTEAEQADRGSRNQECVASSEGKHRVVRLVERLHEHIQTIERIQDRKSKHEHIVLIVSDDDIQMESLPCGLTTFNSTSMTQAVNRIADMLYVNHFAHKYSFSIFVNDKLDASIISSLGSTYLSQNLAYGDSSHFNRGMALKLLFEGTDQRFTTSFQASIMVLGSPVRVYPSTDLHVNSVLRHLYDPGFPPPLNRCLRWREVVDDGSGACDVEEMKYCADGTHCSPIRGCKEDSQRHSGTDRTSAYIRSDSSLHQNFTLQHLVRGRVEVHGTSCVGTSESHPSTIHLSYWDPQIPFALKASKSSKPLIFRNTVASTFPALNKWKQRGYLEERVTDIGQVKVGKKGVNKFYDPDVNAPLYPNLNDAHRSEGYTRVNLTAKELFSRIITDDDPHKEDKGEILGAFFEMSKELRPDIDTSLLFLTKEDRERAKQFLWISTAGFNTFTHVDHDMNLFVQISGYKRFTLFLNYDLDNMYMFPRVHPMWHKSKVDFYSPDLSLSPNFRNASAYTALLGPGDVLYIPPYTWHHVESLTPSISLTTWSHTSTVYEAMEKAYGVELYFEKHMTNKRGKTFALRLFLDLFIQQMYGYNQTSTVINRLLVTRYVGLEDIFASDQETCDICKGNAANMLPIARFLYSHLSLEVDLVAQHFMIVPTSEVSAERHLQ